MGKVVTSQAESVTMDINVLTLIGAIIITPIITILTLWIKNSTAKDTRRDARDDGYIKSLDERITLCEGRHATREKEISEIRQELKNRDVEYVKLYQENATIRAKYEILQEDHDDLKAKYEATVGELSSLKDAVQKDRQATADLATQTASTL